MQIQQLTYFVAIAEQGSINKAAEKLFVTQPNLSKAISNLENELKVRIFNRTNKGVAQMQTSGIMIGKENNQFDPAGAVTRAELAVVMQRIAAL